ncbi:hypothetical protein D3C80_1765420 [compost metagenome]
MFDARLCQGNLTHALDDVFCAVKAGSVRQLGKANQILLVLCGHEATGHGIEDAIGCTGQRHVDKHDDTLA